jgi:hypothetical protein
MTRIEELTLKLLDDAISGAEVEELETLVERGEPGVNDHFLLLDIEAALRGDSGGPDLGQPVLERLAAESAARTARQVLQRITGLPDPVWRAGPAAAERGGRRRRAWGVRSLAAVAALLIVAMGLAIALRGPRVPAPAVGPGLRVVEVQGRLEILTPGRGSQVARVGQDVAPGQTLRTEGEEGFAVVEFADRTRLDLGHASVVRLLGAEGDARGAEKRVLVSSGVLSADVAPQREGQSLVILTPVAQVRVPGAAALLSVTTPDCTWVDLRDGRAEMIRQADGMQVEVEAGSSATVRSDLEEVIITPKDLPRHRPRRRLSFAPAHTLAFSADGGSLLAANSRWVFRHSLLTGAEESQPLPTPFRDGTRATLSRDGSTLALAMPEELSVWETTPIRRRLSLAAPGLMTRPIALAPDGRWLAARDGDPGRPTGVLLWDDQGSPLLTSWDAGGDVRNLASSPDGGQLIIGTRQSPGTPTHRISLLDIASGVVRTTLVTDLQASWQLVLAPDGERLATVGSNGVVQVWNAATRSLEGVIDARERPVRSLAFSPDGRLLAGGTVYGSVILWDVETVEERAELKAEQRGVRLLAFSPDGKTLATGTLFDPILLWDVPAPVPVPPGGPQAVEGTRGWAGGQDQ